MTSEVEALSSHRQQVFISQHPLVAHKLAKLRSTQTEPKKFRELVREITILLAYEATADLALGTRRIDTWAGPLDVGRCDQDAITVEEE